MAEFVIIPTVDKTQEFIEIASDYTRYFLDHPRKAHRIEVFVLKDYLPQKLGIGFRPRTAADIQ